MRFLAFSAGCALPLQEESWSTPRAIVHLEGLSDFKIKVNYLIGNRTRDLLTCGLVPQTTMLTRVSQRKKHKGK
jgi:hypothetical protein